MFDSKPRTLSEDEARLLQDLAAIVVNELELRQSTKSLAKQAYAIDAALQEAERNRHLFERIADLSPDIIYVIDLATRQSVYVNRDAIAHLGYPREKIRELGHAALSAVLHPDDAERVTKRFAEFEHMTDDARSEFSYRLLGADGVTRWFLSREVIFSRHRDRCPKEILGVAADITELKQIEERLATLATTDELTGVANQRAFRERLAQLVAEGDRNRRFALCIADIDHFKHVNDTHGHPVGDRALVAVARTLTTAVRRVDHVSRYGGEEFAMLFVDVDEALAATLAERLRRAVARIVDPVTLTASFGVAAHTPGMPAESLMRSADAALYAAKEQGRNRVVPASQLKPR